MSTCAYTALRNRLHPVGTALRSSLACQGSSYGRRDWNPSCRTPMPEYPPHWSQIADSISRQVPVLSFAPPFSPTEEVASMPSLTLSIQQAIDANKDSAASLARISTQYPSDFRDTTTEIIANLDAIQSKRDQYLPNDKQGALDTGHSISSEVLPAYTRYPTQDDKFIPPYSQNPAFIRQQVLTIAKQPTRWSRPALMVRRR
jgi:hypothetical protein